MIDKAASLFVRRSAHTDVPASAPTHDPYRARDLISHLHLGLHRAVGEANFARGIDPDTAEHSDGLYLAAYGDTFILASHLLVDACLYGPQEPFVERLMTHFPDAQILAIRLHAPVGLYAYAYYEAGECVRIHAGSQIDGVISDYGSWLPEEKPYYSSSYFRYGSRVVPMEVDEETLQLSQESFGESIINILAARFLGQPLDAVDAAHFPMELFVPLGSHLMPKLQRAWGHCLYDIGAGRTVDDPTLSVARSGQWLYDNSVPQRVTIVELTGFDHPSFDGDDAFKDFFRQKDGTIRAFHVFFGDLHNRSFEMSSHGPFRTLKEAIDIGEEKAPTPVDWD